MNILHRLSQAIRTLSAAQSPQAVSAGGVVSPPLALPAHHNDLAAQIARRNAAAAVKGADMALEALTLPAACHTFLEHVMGRNDHTEATLRDLARHIDRAADDARRKRERAQ